MRIPIGFLRTLRNIEGGRTRVIYTLFVAYKAGVGLLKPLAGREMADRWVYRFYHSPWARVKGTYRSGERVFALQHIADLTFLREWYEAETKRYIAALPEGGFFVDVGAHMGVFSILFAERYDSVLAVEPDPYNYSRLAGHVKMNGLNDKVSTVPCALSEDERATIRLYRASDGSGGHSLTPETGRQEVEVPNATFDGLLDRLGLGEREIALLKLDVEGAELRVLRGARRALTRNVQRVILETLDPEAETGARNFLGPFGFQMRTKLDRRNLVFERNRLEAGG